MGFQREQGGEPIPGYRLIERLGGGGFGEVWKVEAPGGIHKAIKFVYGDVRTASEEGARAGQELKAIHRVKQVRHPYILSLERFEVIEGQLLIIMELADKNLWDRFRECRSQGLPGIPRDELLRYMFEIGEALDLMNIEHQLQHLDIKPQNLFLVYNHVKVADFGLVKDLEGMVASVTGGVTPVYAAPETFDGLVTRFSDQYSLGIVYQELLTGQRPFTGTNIHQLVMQHVQGKPNLAPLSAADQAVIARSLSKNPDERFPSCSEMAQALRAAKEGGVETPAPAPVQSEPHVPVETPRVVSPPHAEVPGEGTTTIPIRPHVPHESPVERSAGPALLETPAAVITPRAGFTIPTPPPAPPAPPLEPVPVVREAPPEVSGEGELFPALVVGIGEIGVGILQKLRESIKKAFTSADALNNLRLVGIDTDPDSLQALAKTGHGIPLAGADTLLTKLNRPVNYLKARDGRPRIESWFNTNMLYRIQRNLTTGGLRALGRLAFIDNYRTIVHRLRSDLEACLEPKNMERALRHTGLRLRSNRPRVYIVTGLGGGTGSGMFIDLAYVVRSQLKQLGYAEPDVVGVLLVPGADRESLQKSAGSKAVVNAFSALTELNHFSASDVGFTARYDEREGNLIDKGAPFQRTVVLPLPAEGQEADFWRTLGSAGEYLFRDLATKLGRVADQSRGKLPEAEPNRALACQTFGMVPLWWPRHEVLRRAARHFCRLLVDKWAARELRPGSKERIQAWVEEQWTRKDLSAEAQIARLQAACARTIGQSPEAVFESITEPFVSRGWFGSTQVQIKVPTVREAVAKIDSTVGRPTSSSVLYKPGALEETLRVESEALLQEWEQKLLQVTSRLLDHPDFLLTGAEETIRQFAILIDQTLKVQDPLSQALAEQASLCNERLQILLDNLDDIVTGGRRTAHFATELVELFRTYPKARYEGMVLKVVTNSLTAVRGRLADQLREIGYCRNRLVELTRVFASPLPDNDAEDTRGHCLLPVHCKNLDEAIDGLVEKVSMADLLDLEKKINNVVRQQFRGLSNVCTGPSSVLKNLEDAMEAEATKFAAAKAVGYDLVEMYLSRYADDGDAKRTFGRMFDSAAPALVGREASSRTEICVLACPNSPHEARLRDLARKAVPDGELLPSTGGQDIVFYREEARFPLDRLSLLGQAGHQTYRHANVAENFTTHTRTDIPTWREVGPP